MFWLSVALIALAALVVAMNLHLFVQSALDSQRHPVAPPYRSSPMTLVGSILAILGAMLSPVTYLTWAAACVVLLDPSGIFWLPLRLIRRRSR